MWPKSQMDERKMSILEDLGYFLWIFEARFKLNENHEKSSSFWHQLNDN
jgi:hypothetical protein